MSFDPDAWLETWGGAAKAVPAVPTVKSPPTNTTTAAGVDYASFYQGIDRLKGGAFSPLEKDANPSESKARVVNQLYLQKELNGMDVTNNWQAVKEQYASTKLGVDKKGITDESLYGYIQAKLQDDDDPTGWKGEYVDGRENWDIKPISELGGQIDTSKIKDKSLYVAASVWNGIQPALASMTAPSNLMAMGGTVSLAKSGVAEAKPVLKAVSGVFGALMTKYGFDELPTTLATATDPASTLAEKITSITSNVSKWLMAFGSSYGAFTDMGIKPKLDGKTITEAVGEIEKEIPKAPMEAVEPLKAAANQLRDLDKAAPKVSIRAERQKGWDAVKQGQGVGMDKGQETKTKQGGDPAKKNVAALEGLAKGVDEARKLFNAAGRGPAAAVTAGSLREHGAELAQRTDRAAAALEEASKTLMKMPESDRWDFIDRVETGKDQPNEDLQQAHDSFREILDTKRKEIQDMGTGKLDHFIKDYFPHIWKDPDEAITKFQQAQGKAPLEGGKSFLKQRSIPTIKQGLALGLEPVSTNPVEMVLLKAREMDKYILGQKWMQEMKDKELVKYVKAGDEAPQGFVKINDPIATVYGPKKGAVRFDSDVNELTVSPEQVQVMGRRIMGEYYAPDEVATVANNYLSPGLRKSALFRGYLTAANSLNQFQLGLSAFHLGFTSLDTSISKMALALEYGKEGKLMTAAREAAKIPVAPITNILQGNKVLNEWLRPGTQGEEIAKIADAVRMAGGRAKMDSIYQTNITKRMQQLWGEGGMSRAGAVWRVPFAAMEQLSKPLMEYIVPRQKLGVAADLMRKEMDKLGPNATPDDMRAAFGKAWDSVDNRMGQLVYDNLFWNKTIKDLSMASVRSVGWNLGTIRELGGGVVDTAAFLKDTIDPKKKAEFTHRMAYSISLPIMTGLMGATYQYLQTGKGPEELRDYYFPKNGDIDPQGRYVRKAMPSYMKDVYHYGHDPVETVAGKFNPFPEMISEMLMNKDFFGREIRHSDDPMVKQMQDEVTHFVENFEPISLRQFSQSKAAGGSAIDKAQNFVGITNAPNWVGESTAEQLAQKINQGQPHGNETPDEELIQRKGAAQKLFLQGNDEEAEAILDKLADAGQLTGIQRKNIERGTDKSFLENQVSRLDAGEAMRVYKVADLKERAVLKDAIQTKLDKAHITEEKREALQAEFDRLTPPDRDIDHSER